MKSGAHIDAWMDFSDYLTTWFFMNYPPLKSQVTSNRRDKHKQGSCRQLLIVFSLKKKKPFQDVIKQVTSVQADSPEREINTQYTLQLHFCWLSIIQEETNDLKRYYCTYPNVLPAHSLHKIPPTHPKKRLK